MEYFKSLTSTALVELINSTRKELYLCIPALHPEIADAIIELDYMQNHDKEKVRIKLLVDFDAQTFRQGYGDFQSVEDLFKGEFEIRNLKDNRISFVISDNSGYYLFIESRSLIPADKETINAVKIDSVSRIRLKNYFFPDEEKKDFQNELADAIIEESKTLDKPEELIPDNPASVLDLSIGMVKKVKTDLEKNPPLNPDYKKIVEFYSNKFQYVKLKFEGANLQYRKVEIPSKALPVMDAKLKDKLETKLNLFEKSGKKEYFKPLNDFKSNIAEIRDRFLKKVKSREESLLEKSKKKEFESEVEKFDSKMNKVKSDIISIIASQIEHSKERLLTDLNEFFIANPKSLFPDHPKLWINNEPYIKQAAKSKAEEIIHRYIRWPAAHLLVDEFKLIQQYSDITYEDLKSEQFIAELIECELISEKDKDKIAEFRKGIEIKS
jgi:hypothetical protein